VVLPKLHWVPEKEAKRQIIFLSLRVLGGRVMAVHGGVGKQTMLGCCAREVGADG
jgi:hypothetical protein